MAIGASDFPESQAIAADQNRYWSFGPKKNY